MKFFLLLAILLSHFTAQSAPVTFLNDEAGLVAWFQFTNPVNLHSNQLRNLFRYFQTANDQYLLGWMPTQGFENYPSQDIKVFIDNKGWVVAYYLKSDPASKIFFQPPGNNRLETALSRIAASIDVTRYQIHYSNFKTPLAEKAFLIQSTCSANGQITINFPPLEQFYERAWYAYVPGLFSGINLTIDNKLIGNYGWGIYYNPISDYDMVSNAKHIISYQCPLASVYFGFYLSVSGKYDPDVVGADTVQTIALETPPDGLIHAALDVPRIFPAYLPMVNQY